MMFKSRWTIISFLICVAIVFSTRINYHSNNAVNGYNATTWDALGYYIYLPASIIYNDVSDLEWFEEVDEKYQLSGGTFYQATELEDGKHVFKYLGGVAILQLPFFLVGHVYASITDYPADGFSAPYQYAIIWGAVLWFLLGLWVLTKVLQKYFNDEVVAITILLLVAASNLLQYVSVDGAMSHSFLFPMYSFLLWFTIKWHEKAKIKYAFLIGLIIGVSTISRPTELIMIFIPLLWGVNSKQDLKGKIQLLKEKRVHLLVLVLAGFLGVFPQLFYWKVASGDWIYNVGSKWYFLNPWWRVLVGFEKGWFIYTPVAIFMVIGLFFLKHKVFQKAVIIFCVLNIWIIIAWSDWRYGASYSTRALTHIYPVFALALAAIITKLIRQKYSVLFGLLAVYLIATNLFQIRQYNAGILHYDDMNRKYYARIYWNLNPSPLDYSLMDTKDILSEKSRFGPETITQIDFDTSNLALEIYESILLAEIHHPNGDILVNKISIKTTKGFNEGFIKIKEIQSDTVFNENHFRLSLPFYTDQKTNEYEHHFFIDDKTEKLQVLIESFGRMEIEEVKASVRLGER